MVKGLHVQLLKVHSQLHPRGCGCDECLNPNPRKIPPEETILMLLNKRPEGMSFKRAHAVLSKVYKIDLKTAEAAFTNLLNQGRIGVTAKIFYLRDNPLQKV